MSTKSFFALTTVYIACAVNAPMIFAQNQPSVGKDFLSGIGFQPVLDHAKVGGHLLVDEDVGIVVEVNQNDKVAQVKINDELRTILEYRYARRIEGLKSNLGLNKAQCEKLTLAASNECYHFERDRARIEFDINSTASRDPYGLHQILVRIRPIRVRMSSGVMIDESLFMKVLDTTLSDEQKLKYMHWNIEPTKRIIDRLESLSTEQRTKVVSLIYEQKVDVPYWSETIGPLKLTKIEDSKLSEFLTDEQILTVRRLIFADLTLKQNR